MPKYLIEGSYSADGLKGVHKDGGSGRKDAAGKAIKSAGGKLDSIYFAFGDRDVVAIADFPDNISAAAASITVSASGMVRLKLTPLMTVEDVDAVAKKSVAYRPPGK
jgi:uncharacterized protein with GYD domain